MRCPSLLLSLATASLLLCAVTATAGAASPDHKHAGVVGSSTCPVELTAKQAQAQGFAYAARPGVPGATQASQQAIDLSIRNGRLARIVGADLEVHGTAPRPRSLHTQSAMVGTAVSDAVRTVHLEGSVPANQQRTHRLSVDQLTSVQWLSIIELRYADGSVWHAGPGRECRVEPNPLLPINEQALAK